MTKQDPAVAENSEETFDNKSSLRPFLVLLRAARTERRRLAMFCCAGIRSILPQTEEI